jgi:hypothetical protein
METLQPLLHEISRLKFYPGTLLFKACDRISSLLPEFAKEFDLNAPVILQKDANRNDALVWLENVKRAVYKAYDQYRIRIQEATMLAIAICEGQNDEEQQRAGLSLLMSFAYMQQNPSKEKILNFSKRFVKLIRNINLSEIDLTKSFLYQQFDFKFDSFEKELEWFCRLLEMFPEITVQPWQAAMMHSSFLMAKTFEPIISAWRQMVLDISGKIESEPVQFTNKIIENVATIQSKFDYQEQDTVESDLQMTIDALIHLQQDRDPPNMTELLEMFERRTGYDMLSLFTILNAAKTADKNQVEIVEARARDVIAQERNAFEKEYDLYEKALRSFEVQKISNTVDSEDYTLFKEAAQLHFKQDSKTWQAEMQLFELAISDAEKLQLFALFEKLFAASQKLDELQDELNGILTKNKRTLKRIQADKAKANTHALLAEASLKSHMAMTGLTLEDDGVKQIMFLLLDKKIRLRELEQTLTSEFKQINVDAFKSIRGYLRLYFDAVDTVKYFELEEEKHLSSKSFWKIILTVAFFFLWGALIYFIPQILLGITDTLFSSISEEGPNPEWMLSNVTTVQNVTNATSEILNNVTKETGILATVIGSTFSTFNNILSWGTSKASEIYVRGFKKGRLDTLLQNTGFIGFDYDRLNPRNFVRVVLKGQFGNIWMVLGYYWVIYRLMKSVLPMWMGFSISSARLVTETYFEDNFVDSLTMESAILASNFGIMKSELIMASTSFCVQLMDRGKNLQNLVMQVGSFVAMGKAGVVPAVYTIANANSSMPDDMKMYIDASQKKDVSSLWITQQDMIRKGSELMVEWKQKKQLDSNLLEDASKKPAEKLRIEFPEQTNRLDSESLKNLQITVISDDEDEE